MIDPRIIASIGPEAVVNSSALVERLANVRIGLSIGTGPTAEAIGATVADQLVRMFREVGAQGVRTREHLEQAIEWVGSEAVIVDGECDLTIVVGDGTSYDGNDRIFAGANGWRVYQSALAAQPAGALGLGAPAAGYLAVLAAFQRIFADWIGGDCELPGEVAWSLFDWSVDGKEPGPPLEVLDLGELVWGGTGAVAHGGFWALSLLPHVAGAVTLVDPDRYGPHSVERYAGARRVWLEANKTDALREWFGIVFPDLHVSSVALDLNSWYASHRPDCHVELLVTTPDSQEARRHAALKLPKTVISGWAERFEMGVETFTPSEGRCLACAYSIDSAAVTETNAISIETGLDPWRVQDLLDSAEPIGADEAARIAAAFGRPVDELIGKPLRSVRQHLCAVGQLRPPGGQEAADVPLGFVSALTGVALLAEIVRFRLGQPTGKRWQFDARLMPTNMNAWRIGRDPDCFVCGDEDFRQVYASMYGNEIEPTASRHDAH